MYFLKPLFASACLCLVMTASSQVRLPQLVSNGMVLQRDARINIWGWASPGEKVHVRFNGKKYAAMAGLDSLWQFDMGPLNAGGPYTMDISASNHIVLSDVVIGDVWFCSGQSNMVLNMERVKEKYPDDISQSEYPLIRNFFVPTAADVQGLHKDLPPGKWVEADPQHTLTFGAVSFFFAKQLFQKYRVPIGIINSSVGGTPIQSWISETGLKNIAAYTDRLNKDRTTPAAGSMGAPSAGPTAADLGLSGSRKWYDPEYQPQGWHAFWLPGYWADQGVKGLNGIVWFRKEIDVPPSMTGVAAKLFLGRIVDADQTYVNGQLVGGITYQYPPRRYDLSPGLLKPGKNIIVVRLTSTSGKGGFVPDKNYSLVAGDQKIDLRGDWQYQVGLVFDRPAFKTWSPPFSPQNEPTGLFNTMVAPAIRYGIKGFLWYQGEANTSRPEEYNQLLPALVTDWRNQWKEGDLPFLYVQLPNFMEAQYSPSESQWAVLREAQLHALSLPNTGMAVTIDAGEWNDIHPLNKKVVGERLALLAESIAYGDKKVSATGPLYRSSRVDGKRIILRFSGTGGGLATCGAQPGTQFSVAGPDGHFVWANAEIAGDSVIISSPNVPEPLYVRYAWADNPQGATLCSHGGLPASPFRTDDPFGMYAGPGAALPSGVSPGLPVWNNKQCAVVLTYDDAIDIDLDNVVPALDSFGFRGTFYLIGSSNVVEERLSEWRHAAAEGHELGNHALFHPCDGSLPGRSFVTPDNDLSKYTVSRAVSEIRVNNAYLKAIDGKDKRTFAYPCGDLKIGDTFFYTQLTNDFVGARGVRPVLQPAAEVDLSNMPSFPINGQSADFLINLVKQAEQTHTLLVFLFHGVGGGHDLNEGLAEHTALLRYLKAHEQEIWIAPMVEVAENIKAFQQNARK